MILNPILPLAILVIISLILGGLMWWLMPTRLLKGLGICVVALLLLIGMRPMIPNGEALTFKKNVDIIFVLDNTLSMLAEDYNGNARRIDAVVDDVQYIVNNTSGAYYSLITFDNAAKINLRSTVDANAAVTAVKTTHKMDDLYARGSTVTIFKEDLKKMLETLDKKEDRKKIVFVISDGENTSEQPMASLADLRGHIDGGAVLGYGTSQGGKMKMQGLLDEDGEYLKDWSSSEYPPNDAISKIDEDNLRKMANELGIEYIHMDKQSNVQGVIDRLKELGSTEGEGDMMYAYNDLYYFFCWPLGVIVILMLFFIKKEYA